MSKDTQTTSKAKATATKIKAAKADPVAKVREYFANRANHQPGAPLNVPAGYVVACIIPDDCDEAQARSLRLKLEAQGAAPDHTDGVIVPNLPGAEIWLMDHKAAAVKFQLKKARNDARREAMQGKAKARVDLQNRPLRGDDLDVLEEMRG